MSEICIPDTMRNMITIFLTVLLQQWVYVWGQLWHFIIYSQECPSVPLLSLRTNKVRVVGCRQVSLLQFLVAGNKNCFWPTQQTRKPFRVLSSRTRPGYLLASRQQVMVDSSFGAQQLIEDMRLFLLALLATEIPGESPRGKVWVMWQRFGRGCQGILTASSKLYTVRAEDSSLMETGMLVPSRVL